MFGILGEDDSDVKTLKTIVKRIAGKSSSVSGKGYDGCAEMLRKGARDILAMWRARKARKFIVCHDADHTEPNEVRANVWQRSVEPSQLDHVCCIVIPVQEIEAWILADLDAVRQVIRKFPAKKPIPSPESVDDPKDRLERMSEDERGKRLYEHTRHNEKVAAHLDLALVRNKCPSYAPFEDFVLQ